MLCIMMTHLRMAPFHTSVLRVHDPDIAGRDPLGNDVSSAVVPIRRSPSRQTTRTSSPIRRVPTRYPGYYYLAVLPPGRRVYCIPDSGFHDRGDVAGHHHRNWRCMVTSPQHRSPRSRDQPAAGSCHQHDNCATPPWAGQFGRNSDLDWWHDRRTWIASPCAVHLNFRSRSPLATVSRHWVCAPPDSSACCTPHSPADSPGTPFRHWVEPDRCTHVVAFGNHRRTGHCTHSTRPTVPIRHPRTAAWPPGTVASGGSTSPTAPIPHRCDRRMPDADFHRCVVGSSRQCRRSGSRATMLTTPSILRAACSSSLGCWNKGNIITIGSLLPLYN